MDKLTSDLYETFGYKTKLIDKLDEVLKTDEDRFSDRTSLPIKIGKNTAKKYRDAEDVLDPIKALNKRTADFNKKRDIAVKPWERKLKNNYSKDAINGIVAIMYNYGWSGSDAIKILNWFNQYTFKDPSDLRNIDIDQNPPSFKDKRNVLKLKSGSSTFYGYESEDKDGKQVILAMFNDAPFYFKKWK